MTPQLLLRAGCDCRTWSRHTSASWLEHKRTPATGGDRNFPAGRRDPWPVRSAGTGILERAHGGQGPALAELIRSEQDLSKQINAQLGTLNNLLALPSSEREENAVRAINASIDKLRDDRNKARADIARRFPTYADLIDPKPPTVEAIRDTLRQGEALLSFYFGRDRSFVWAVAKQGPVSFALLQ